MCLFRFNLDLKRQKRLAESRFMNVEKFNDWGQSGFTEIQHITASVPKAQQLLMLSNMYLRKFYLENKVI